MENNQTAFIIFKTEDEKISVAVRFEEETVWFSQSIHDIRASEKVFYRQVPDFYSTNIDYDPKTEGSTEFFSKVKNKIHFAMHGQTTT